MLVSLLLTRRDPGPRDSKDCCCCWLLDIPVTCLCISGTDLLRQFYVLPHWERSCRSNFLLHPVTGPTILSADPTMPGALQGSHWSANLEVTGMTPLHCKQDLDPGSSPLEADALTTRPMTWRKARSKPLDNTSCEDMLPLGNLGDTG